MRVTILIALLTTMFSIARGAVTTQATTAPATTQAAEVKFPTPAELVEKMKQMRAEKDALLKVAYIDLSDPIVETPPGFSLFGDPNVATLRSVLQRIEQARDDKDVRGILITIGDPQIGVAQAQEIRDELLELRKARKRTFVYADSYDTDSYTLATGATDICLLEDGEIMIPGVGGEAMFAKGLLDKVGVKADSIQIGEYKGAEEQYTRTGPSDELRGEMNKLMDAMYNQLVDGISLNRNLAKDEVKRMIDDAMLSAKPALDRGYVDHLVDQDGLRELIGEELGGEINLLHGYGEPERAEVDMSNPWALLSALSKRPEVSDKPAVALIYAEGMIVDGDGGEGMFGRAIGSEDMREALRMANRDEKVKAVVIRIDSPGGSALASEAMWQAARRVADEKPLIISIGGMAASGGYYLASAGDTIYADPAGIVGSIGVVGGKFVLKDLFDKLGLTTEPFVRGKNADLFSSNVPWNERQRRMLTNWMKQTYDQFTARVMETRGDRIKDIDKVARGRIFLAADAKALGMVDEIGGIQDAIAHAAEDADLAAGEFDVRVLPPARTLADFFGGGGHEQTASPITGAMRAVAPAHSVSHGL